MPTIGPGLYIQLQQFQLVGQESLVKWKAFQNNVFFFNHTGRPVNRMSLSPGLHKPTFYVDFYGEIRSSNSIIKP